MLTRMGFGGAPLGNLYRKVSEDDAQATLQAAFDAGILNTEPGEIAAIGANGIPYAFFDDFIGVVFKLARHSYRIGAFR